jgi:hypothetical protein
MPGLGSGVKAKPFGLAALGLDTSSPAFGAATMKMTGLEQQTSILIVWWTCPDNPAWFHENRP